MKTIKIYKCSCGYKTLDINEAIRHETHLCCVKGENERYHKIRTKNAELTSSNPFYILDKLARV